MFDNLITVTEQSPSVDFSKPLPLPPGFVLTGALSNADDYEGQNMNVLVNAYLSGDPLFRDCR
jgi:CRISPR/Cas system-associated protein Cas5 (RAMP superfamily)